MSAVANTELHLPGGFTAFYQGEGNEEWLESLVHPDPHSAHPAHLSDPGLTSPIPTEPPPHLAPEPTGVALVGPGALAALAGEAEQLPAVGEGVGTRPGD